MRWPLAAGHECSGPLRHRTAFSSPFPCSGFISLHDVPLVRSFLLLATSGALNSKNPGAVFRCFAELAHFSCFWDVETRVKSSPHENSRDGLHRPPPAGAPGRAPPELGNADAPRATDAHA